MALNTAGLISDLEAFFANPGSMDDVRSSWASIIRDYTNAISPAVPAPTQDAAAGALEAALVGLNAPGAAVGVISAALASYALTLAGGMVPPGVPPSAPLSATLTAVAAVLYPTHAAAASAWGSTIDAWFRTGVAGAGAPPPPWS